MENQQANNPNNYKSNLKRLDLLQNQDDDLFFPKYKLACSLPDIPIKPKLFRYKIDQKKCSQYELSSVELNQEHMINVDYNMGMKIDLLDRDLYLPFPKPYKGPAQQQLSNIKREDGSSTQNEQEALEKLRTLLLDEKDRFLLSDRHTFETVVKKQETQEREVRLPARYEIIDRVQKWGVDIKDPLAVRQLSDAEESEDDIIMTSKKEKGKRDVAIRQIERRFANVKKVKVGMSKGPEHPGVTATKVIDFIPFQQLFPNKMALVSCDDVIEDELSKKAENNDFLLLTITENQETQKKLGLYKFNDCENLPADIKEALLGKRKVERPLEELEQAIQLEHVRDYAFNKQEAEEQANDYLLMMNKSDPELPIAYFPLSQKLLLQKKKMQMTRVQRDGEDGGQVTMPQSQAQKYIVLAPRGYVKTEADIINQSFKKISSEYEVHQQGITFSDQVDRKSKEKDEAMFLKSLFSHHKKNINSQGNGHEKDNLEDMPMKDESENGGEASNEVEEDDGLF